MGEDESQCVRCRVDGERGVTEGVDDTAAFYADAAYKMEQDVEVRDILEHDDAVEYTDIGRTYETFKIDADVPYEAFAEAMLDRWYDRLRDTQGMTLKAMQENKLSTASFLSGAGLMIGWPAYKLLTVGEISGLDELIVEIPASFLAVHGFHGIDKNHAPQDRIWGIKYVGSHLLNGEFKLPPSKYAQEWAAEAVANTYIVDTDFDTLDLGELDTIYEEEGAAGLEAHGISEEQYLQGRILEENPDSDERYWKIVWSITDDHLESKLDDYFHEKSYDNVNKAIDDGVVYPVRNVVFDHEITNLLGTTHLTELAHASL